MYLFVIFSLAFRFILLMSGFYLVIWPLGFCSESIFQTVNCNTCNITPALWKFFMLWIPTAVLGFFFTVLKMFLSSTAVFLGHCLDVSTLVVSFFFRTFYIGLLVMPNTLFAASKMASIAACSFKKFLFFQRHLSSLSFNKKCSLHRQNTGLKLLFNQLI